MNNKRLLTIIIIALTVAALACICIKGPLCGIIFKPAWPIKIGILHSLSGTMSISEASVADAALLAIDEINKKGGVLGKRLKPIVADGRSDLQVFAKEAKRLITEEKVSVIFGCWTSASRKTVKPVFEQYNHLLFYPVQYEGLESSPNIVYTGAAPNQQIIPAVKWCFDNLGKRFFLVASDYVFPRSANTIIKDQITALKGEVVGEEYIILGSDKVDGIIQKIIAAKPQVILNTINGDTNIAFFKALRKAGITPDKIPTMSFSIAEDELRHLGTQNMVGDYACWNYFQSIDTPENKAFVDGFKKKYGRHRVTDDPIEAGYFGVYLWAQAVEEAGTCDAKEVSKAIKKQSFLAPQGMVYIDAKTNHIWKTVRIGKIGNDGQFDIMWNSEKPVQPEPYPIYRAKSEWEKLLEALYAMWGKNWENPGIPLNMVNEKAGNGLALIESLAAHPSLVLAAVSSNKKNNDLKQDEIMSLDYRWQNAPKNSELIDKFLANEPSKILAKFRKGNPQFSEIFITDAIGLNVAMTNKTTDYYQSDEDWWLKCYDSGRGKAFFGSIEYDKSAEVWGMPIYAPVYDHNSNTVGVIKAFLDITKLMEQ